MKYLSLTEVLQIHRDQISRYGGMIGIRDIGPLKAALGIPMATYGGELLHTDVFEMASAYFFHLLKKHPFLNGNKRVGAVAALVFLLLNGHELMASEDDLAEMVLSVARGEIDKADVAVFICRWSKAL